MMGHVRKAIMKLTSVIIVIAVTFITVSCSSQKMCIRDRPYTEFITVQEIKRASLERDFQHRTFVYGGIYSH